MRDHNFRWGYTWVKTQLHAAGLVERAKRRGAHRRKRERKPCEGMMLHQDGSRAAWLEGQPELDLIVTMDDATSTIYSAFLVEEEGTASTFAALLEVFTRKGLPGSLYTDRGSHYFYTPKAGEAVDKERLTQVGRALERLGIEHIPAYSPEARGRSERMFGTLQDRSAQGAQAGRHRRHRGRQPLHPRGLSAGAQRPLRQAAGDRGERLRDRPRPGRPRRHPVRRGGAGRRPRQHRRLCRPAGCSCRKAGCAPTTSRRASRCTQYPDGTLAVFHGPRLLARYDASRPGHRRRNLEGLPREPLRRATSMGLWICGQPLRRLPTSPTSQKKQTEADK